MLFNQWQEIARMCEIYGILAKYRLTRLIPAENRASRLQWLMMMHPRYWLHKSSVSQAEALRLALIELGPVFVKFGQALSTRRDLLPDAIAQELAKLQDQVPPFDSRLARQQLERIYQQPLEKVFAEFEEIPLASASIAQVHAAKLPNGKAVVVKLLRPNIAQKLQRDIAVLYWLANVGARFWKKSRKFKIKAREIVAEFENSLLGELDLLREAANASQLRRNFAHSPELYIPQIYWEYTYSNVIVMERIYGISIRDRTTLEAANVNLRLLAERGLEIFLTQVFRDCFFHADMHPGNIFVDITSSTQPRYITVDFGIMGTLSPMDQRYIAENFLAFFNRDYRRVAILHLISGWAPPETRIDQLEMAIRGVCEPIFARPLAEISFGQLLLRLFQMAAQFDIEIQPQLILLQKTLLNVEGLARYLYPQLDLWQTAKPFLERWIKTQMGPRAFVRKVRENLPLWLEQLPEWPQLLYQGLQNLQKAPPLRQNESSPVRKSEKPRKHSWWFSFWGGVIATGCFMLLLWYVYLHKAC